MKYLFAIELKETFNKNQAIKDKRTKEFDDEIEASEIANNIGML